MDALVDRRQSEQQHSQLTKQQPCRASETVAGSSTATLRVVACLLLPPCVRHVAAIRLGAFCAVCCALHVARSAFCARVRVFSWRLPPLTRAPALPVDLRCPLPL